MPDNILFLFFATVAVWLITLTFFFARLLRHYNTLSRGVSQKSLKTILEDLLKDVDLSKKNIQQLKEYTSKLDKEGSLHVQKIGLLRFNPFKDTGGDQSFVLSLVDSTNTGVIISALYSRSGTRWYAKRVVEGKGSEYELSDEEKQVLKEGETVKN
ncbi:MAG: hypothetical protein A3B38_02960 [Candidatus Levybacteria bacterium RIFCSPLOWO2_01_FULL_36_13]|nr:MAG: hypothetical protein A2684_04050 [Candidatus Levybacteria bacterium RIFCSPHIGHO2_01_FULL_36_15b]OGH35852.1 MAG: hypothetical protein A3B38_02960 [Candidatus Levybacteria bacterium RIFCSPLOWO2_01_FULL_36_13]